MIQNSKLSFGWFWCIIWILFLSFSSWDWAGTFRCCTCKSDCQLHSSPNANGSGYIQMYKSTYNIVICLFTHKAVKHYIHIMVWQSRGMQSTIYVEMTPGVTIEDLYKQLKIAYEVFVSWCDFHTLVSLLGVSLIHSQCSQRIELQIHDTGTNTPEKLSYNYLSSDKFACITCHLIFWPTIILI